MERMPDLTGKVAIVTGANASTGLGFHIAHQLALKGAKVYVGARSLIKATKAIQEMKDMSVGVHLDLHPFMADLGNFKEVQKAADSLIETETRLDILVNSAASVAGPFVKDQYGISQSFSINHLGPFLLTTKLLPLIKKTAELSSGVRVVNVSSSTHYFAPLETRFRSLDDFNEILGSTDDFASNLNRYGVEKLANVLFAKELDRHFRAHGVEGLAVSVHPGGVKTDGSIRWIGPENVGVLETSLSPLDGALTALFAATDPIVWKERDRYAGAYLTPYGVISTPSEPAQNVELAAELWKTSEAVIHKALAVL
ncbi:NAD-P-binding protein [Mycena floridula]|nr:NAD-P-binding protein [Mycena floridula]